MNRINHISALSSVACFLFGVSGMLHAQAVPTYSQVMQEHPDWVQVPGALVRPDCVHEIPEGATVEIAENGDVTGDVTMNGEFVAHYDACPEAAIVTRPHSSAMGFIQDPGTGNGWVEASEWDVSLGKNDNIDYLGGSWPVPKKPAKNGGLIYLFNGIEPSGGTWILQPVLQYGASPAGGGNYYAVASWLVSSGGTAYHSTLKKVAVGDTITGFTELTAVSGGKQSWWVEAIDGSITSTLKVKTSTKRHWTWAFAGVLEAYGISTCSEFPASGKVKFFADGPYHGFPSYNLVTPEAWTGAVFPFTGGPSCGYSVSAGTNSTLFF